MSWLIDASLFDSVSADALEQSFSCDSPLHDAKQKISYWPTKEPIFSEANRKIQNARPTLIAYQVLIDILQFILMYM